MRSRFSRSGRRPIRRDRRAEVPRLHRGRRRDRDVRGPRDRDMRDRDYYTEEEYDRMDEDLPEARLPRRRRSRKYQRDRSAIETARTNRTAIEMAMRDRDSVRRRRAPLRSRDSAEDELMDLDLDAILEVPEDEIEEELPLEEEEKECPPGCVSEEKVDEALEEDEEEDKDKDEDKDEDDKDKGDKEDEKEDEDKKEAAVEPEVEPEKIEELTEAATEEPESVPESAKWAPLFSEADVQRLDTSAEVVLVPFLQQEDPSYVVLANSRPIGEIRMSDLTDVDEEDRHALFTAESFPKGIVQAAEHLGAANVLSDLGLRYYANLVTRRQADAAAKTAVQADLEEAFQTRAADLKQRFINNVLLAVEASNKNLFLDNPLRDAIRENFRGAGVPDAVVVDLFEDAMQKAGSNYFLAMVQKADEWLGFEKEALTQIESTIKDAGYSHPADRGVQIEADVYEGAVRSAPTVPIRTMAPAPQREAEVNEWDASESAIKNVLRNAGTIRRGR